MLGNMSMKEAANKLVHHIAVNEGSKKSFYEIMIDIDPIASTSTYSSMLLLKYFFYGAPRGARRFEC